MWVSYLALSIENPIDPIKDDDIKRVKTELRELIVTAMMNKFKKLVQNKSIAQMAKDIEDFQERKKAKQAIFDWKTQDFEMAKTPSLANLLWHDNTSQGLLEQCDELEGQEGTAECQNQRPQSVCRWE